MRLAAQIFNLLYRRIPFCRLYHPSRALERCYALPIENRRYSRLKICVTSEAAFKSKRPRNARFFLLVACFLSVAGFAQTNSADLENGFIHPPDSARPWVNWFWMDGNVSKEGITADLEAMKRVGIGGALLMPDVSQELPRGPVKFGSEQFYALLHHAISEADRLNLKLSINNDPGWSGSGGPWITPELSMQQLVWNKTNVTGPLKYEGPLPHIEPVKGYEKDVAILAFPTLVGDGAPLPNFAPKITANFRMPAPATNLIDHNISTGISIPASSKGKPQYLQLGFPEPFRAQRLTLTTSVSNQIVSGELQVSDDGRSFRKVREFVIRRPVLALEFEEVAAKHFRILFSDMQPAAKAMQLWELELVPLYRIALPQVKSGMGRAPWPPPQQTNVPDFAVVHRDKVLDLTDKVTSSGHLMWDVPPGEWTVIRFGHVPTGVPNHPPTPAGLGLECDKLSKTAIEKHFEAFVGKAAEGADRLRGRGGLVGTHIDSWEIGFQNWTEDFLAEFRNRRGYEALRFLPAYTGRIVESAEMSERFFWDVRRTVADLLADNYAGHLAELAHQHGLRLSIEAYANGPFDQLQYGSRADVPMAEFWTEHDDNSRWHTARVMASAAHTSGKTVVAAEAFTSHPVDGSWVNHPFSLKPLADAGMCEGINHFVIHCFAHQPWLDLKPGVTMGPFGVHYDRNETWWEKTKPWHDYLARCQYLLQSGLPVVDVCYLSSEGAYTDPPVPAKLEPPLPQGYDYDFAPPEALQRMSVKDGRVVLPDGMSYDVLVLPASDEMTLEFLRKVKQLVDGGATIIGPKRPLRSPSLTGYPSSDEEVRRLAQDLWQGREEIATKPQSENSKGKVLVGKPLKRTLATAEVEPDFEQMGQVEGNPLRWIHRRTSETDIYFVANSNAQPARVKCAFRVKELTPELWLPDSGEIRRPAQWKQNGTTTVLPLDLDAFGSLFVIFRQKSQGTNAVTEISRNGKPDEQSRACFDVHDHLEIMAFEPGKHWAKTGGGKVLEWTVTNLPAPLELEGPWEVTFANSNKKIRFDRLSSWTEQNDREVKYFSGTAKYLKSFDVPAGHVGETRRTFLDLGDVRVIASVRLNGNILGTIWKPPFRVETTKALRTGTNNLEIEVVNLWVNRLIGDEQHPDDCEWKPYITGGGCGLLKWPNWLPDGVLSLKSKGQSRPNQRETFSTWKYWRKDSPLLESGLLGPVKIITAETLRE
jgi:hypothetical protein